ncbi:TPA: helix-turn-helix domain-containing protein [Neisseria meningitidis]|uniref:helix-turn-helix domain-containing protein n=1 Tax=Neisseria meningitidis TaxID=487 RepID=UPI00027CACBE|nr:helix-turn-helix domain-containing protein [Neisseria meningitidis]EJU54831.1 XRE family transcriptional regulator [Neisseria meningitidis 93003]EJU72937.1 XRE family transcriptional regulator [Neisseria meningitidis 80179]EQD21332.1 helix-turn-helix family protein [Neisseria meningitidis NM3230]MBW3946499.1 helix-turn-helix domain-containing protein [Neisseria meningitidis]MBW3949854.1 helix-turn-helix domain-containing protein [Neisseria meningitidis]
MIDSPELGYTPANLKAIRQKYGLTQKQVANIAGATLSTAQKWEAAMSLKTHSDMPHTRWLLLLEYVRNL